MLADVKKYIQYVWSCSYAIEEFTYCSEQVFGKTLNSKTKP